MRQKREFFGKAWKLLAVAMLATLLMGFTSMAAGEKVVDMTAASDSSYVYTGVEEDGQTTVYHRFVVPSTGSLAVSGNSISSLGTTYGISVALCDSNFKVLDPSSSGAYVNAADGDAEIYGVAKGTYYLKVTNYKNYVIAASFEKRTDKGGATKKKAAAIKQGKTVWGVMASGEKQSKADWYKFNVTKSKKLQLTVAVEGNGYLKFSVYGPSYKSGTSLGSLKNSSGTYYSINSLTRKKIKIKTGTYYIKVTRSTQGGSGSYSIKWKLK